MEGGALVMKDQSVVRDYFSFETQIFGLMCVRLLLFSAAPSEQC